MSIDGFTANWTEVAGATGYFIDVYAESGEADSVASTGFDGVTKGSADAYPDGWTISVKDSDNIYDSSGNYGASAPSLKLSADGHCVESPASAGTVTNVAFFFKGNSTAASTLSIFGVGSDGAASEITAISPLAIPTKAADGLNRSFEIPEASGFHAIRLVFNKSAGNLALDDIAVAFKGNVSIDYQIENEGVGNAVSYSVTGLPRGTYHYVVRASNGQETSADSNAVSVDVGAAVPPVALPATDVSTAGFTANWSEAAAATGYLLDVRRVESTVPTRVTEGFDSYVNPETGVPDGWEFSTANDGCYTSSAYSGASPNSVKFSANGHRATSCEYPEAVTNATFWSRGASAGESTLTVEGMDTAAADPVWVEIATVAVANSASTTSLDIDRSLGVRRLRFTFNRVSGSLAFDDVSVAYGGELRVPVLEGQPVAGGATTSYAVSAIAEGRYEYTVRAVYGAAVSAPSGAIAVDVGAPPHAPPAVAPFGAVSARVGERVSVQVVATQEDGDPILSIAVEPPAGLAGEWSVVGDVFTYAPAEGDIGRRVFSVTAESAGGVSPAAELAIDVRRARVPAIPMSGTARRYTQDFDSLGADAGEWDDAAWPLPGWRATYGGAAIDRYSAGTGSGTSGGVYSFGRAGDTDRALGSLAASSRAAAYGVAFTNDTPGAVRKIEIAYTGAQFRVGPNNDSVNTLAFAWRVADGGDISLGGEGWHEAEALSYGSTATATADGSGAKADAGIETRVSGALEILVPPGRVLTLRWLDADDAGNDHALAIDDLVVTWAYGAGSFLMIK